LASIICVALPAATMAADAPPRWAYPENNPAYKPPVDDGKPVRVLDSTAGYTWSQLRDRFIAPIWHPSDHRPMPDIVANGRKPDVFACGYCHRADGPGGPENSDLAGLPKSYIIQQMAEYKSGARGTAVPGRTPPTLMISLSKPITNAERALLHLAKQLRALQRVASSERRSVLAARRTPPSLPPVMMVRLRVTTSVAIVSRSKR
jgi:hypothetical protein